MPAESKSFISGSPSAEGMVRLDEQEEEENFVYEEIALEGFEEDDEEEEDNELEAALASLVSFYDSFTTVCLTLPLLPFIYLFYRI